MSKIFEPLLEAMNAENRIVLFIDDAFFACTENKRENYLWCTFFFSLNDAATNNLLSRIASIAAGRRVKISLSMDEDEAPEFRVLQARGYERTTTSKKGLTQHWEKNHA